jgi:16S rRNA (guanine(527)-N(7))-methyltransferase RsmG
MGSLLPEIPRHQFVDTLAAAMESRGLPGPWTLPANYGEVCHEHFQELRRWNPGLSLVGPGTAMEIVRRHYVESLEGIVFLLDPVTGKAPGKLLDVGSGGGFPGMILAIAAPETQVFLLEPRQRKWAFLRSAARRCGLSCHCLDGRVGDARNRTALPTEIPDGIDLVTCRALALSTHQIESFRDHSPEVRLLFWSGKKDPELPDAFQVRRERALGWSRDRRILEVVPGNGPEE